VIEASEASPNPLPKRGLSEPGCDRLFFDINTFIIKRLKAQSVHRPNSLLLWRMVGDEA